MLLIRHRLIADKALGYRLPSGSRMPGGLLIWGGVRRVRLDLVMTMAAGRGDRVGVLAVRPVRRRRPDREDGRTCHDGRGCGAMHRVQGRRLAALAPRKIDPGQGKLSVDQQQLAPGGPAREEQPGPETAAAACPTGSKPSTNRVAHLPEFQVHSERSSWSHRVVMLRSASRKLLLRDGDGFSALPGGDHAG